MKKNTRVPMPFIQDLRGNGQMPLFYPMAISLVCHVVFLVAFVVTPSLRSERPPARSVINVSMVSIKSATTKDTQPASVGKKPPSIKRPEAAKKPTTAPPVKKTPTVVKKTTPKRKTSLKKKTFKSTQVVKQAIQQLEEKVEAKTDTPPAADQPEPLKSVLDRLKKEVSQAEANRSTRIRNKRRPFSWKNGRKTRRFQ
jgi:outer membrane biosynthesis protein TonB